MKMTQTSDETISIANSKVCPKNGSISPRTEPVTWRRAACTSMVCPAITISLVEQALDFGVYSLDIEIELGRLCCQGRDDQQRDGDQANQQDQVCHQDRQRPAHVQPALDPVSQRQQNICQDDRQDQRDDDRSKAIQQKNAQPKQQQDDDELGRA